jgi:ATP-dependent DNA helicase RecQ
MQKSRDILKQIWGYDGFRPLQEEIVDSAIYGKDVLALLPTGGGKSICFQVPGMARDGLCIVISPLIALMDDQVLQLKNRGLRASMLSSGMSYKEMDSILDNARFGGLDFLYISPERIQTELFRERIKLTEIGLIVVDEAHCISEWGHDFRPAYQEISILREWHPHVPVIAVTATATSKVKEDIISSLKLNDVQLFEAPFDRPNLIYDVYHVKDKMSSLARLCKSHQGQVGIIYCQTRRSAKLLVKYLTAAKVRVAIYHGGLNSRERKAAMKSWLDEKTPVMVATNAFGMGIDKPNVRFVAHYELPNNPEAYFQEAGRAGRDSLSAQTYALIQPNDEKDLRTRIESQFPELDRIKFIYRAMMNFLKIAIGSGADESYPLDIAAFAKRYEFQVNEIYVTLKLLEMNGDLLFREEGMIGSRLRIAVDNAHLYSFQLKNHALDPLISALCRRYRAIFDEFTEIDEDGLAIGLKINEAALTKQLKQLEANGLIDVNWKTNLPLITFLRERLPDDYINLKASVYTFRKEQAFKRLDAMIAFIHSQQCRQRFIIEYFGQKSSDCGRCDYCRAQKETKTESITDHLKLLLATKISLENILSNFDGIQHDLIKQQLREWLVEEQISFSDHLFSWNH